MDGLTAFYEITTAVFAAGAVVVAWVSYRYARDRAGRRANEEQVRRLAREVTAIATDPIGARLAALEATTRELREILARLDTQGPAVLAVVATRVAVLESMTSVFREQADRMRADMESQRDKAAGQRDRLMESQSSQLSVMQVVNDSLRQITQSLARMEAARG